MPNKLRTSFVGKGYYVNHHEKNSHSRRMRLELNLQAIGDAKTAKKFGVPMENVQIRLREDTSLRTGGCETGITLTIEQAKDLTDLLLQELHYSLPGIRELFKTGQMPQDLT